MISGTLQPKFRNSKFEKANYKKLLNGEFKTPKLVQRAIRLRIN